MRPLRLLLSLCSSLIAVTILLYIAFGPDGEASAAAKVAKKNRLKALFSFTSPASLFPPSAIISLTDDNSTFFLARPAAFGPLLPSRGLTGALWIGTGFGDDQMERGELGCSDVPGWEEGDIAAGTKIRPGKTKHILNSDGGYYDAANAARDRRASSQLVRHQDRKQTEHADIELLQENAEIAGKVVLLKRGGCGFLEKVKWAQRRGGVALIVGDDVRGGALIRMYAHGDTSNVTIPALFTSHTTAHLLSSLLPSGGLVQGLSTEDAAKLHVFKMGKDRNKANKGTSAKMQGSRSAPTRNRMSPAQSLENNRNVDNALGADQDPSPQSETSWIHPLLHGFGFDRASQSTSKKVNRRPPRKGDIDRILVDEGANDHSSQESVRSASATMRIQGETPTPSMDSFVIGEQDWRDPDVVANPTTALSSPEKSSKAIQESKPKTEGGNVLPDSGRYSEDDGAVPAAANGGTTKEGHSGLLGHWFGHDEVASTENEVDMSATEGSTAKSTSIGDGEEPGISEQHEGLWVTLTPTNMSSSPFFDTLLVLVVSPLVTLTVVYALLLLRSRIRRRRWRAPKSVVERLPVRTYQTISDTNPSPTATPNATSPTTPLLQHTPSLPTSSTGRPHSRAASVAPATSSSFQQSGRTPEEEKREAGLAEWRRRYGGRQRECVVCLEEYVDGVSQVMSLPCGHEFHAECITPWLVTRRRTCPICKGDVVRSLSQSFRDLALRSPSPNRSGRPLAEDMDDVQTQAAETRNDSPSASQPIPVASGGNPDADDMEANWHDGGDNGPVSPRERGSDLSGSVRELSSTVVTTIWRGFDAILGAPRRPHREEVDRDR